MCDGVWQEVGVVSFIAQCIGCIYGVTRKLSWWMSSAMVVDQNALCSRFPAPTVAELHQSSLGPWVSVN